MFKAYFLLNPGNNPFRCRGESAAALVRDRFPDIHGYVQTSALPGQADVAFSGSAELWFTSAEAALAACEAGPGELIADDASLHSAFAGMERVVMQMPDYLTEERIKGVYPFGRKAGISLTDFQEHWWFNHGPIAALTEEAFSYHQIHALPEAYERLSPVYNGITEITWPNETAAARALDSRQMREDQASDAPNFVNMDSIALFLAREEAVIAP